MRAWLAVAISARPKPLPFVFIQNCKQGCGCCRTEKTLILLPAPLLPISLPLSTSYGETVLHPLFSVPLSFARYYHTKIGG